MRVRHQLRAAVLSLLCATGLAPLGCVSATPEIPAPRLKIGTPPPVNTEMQFSRDNVRKYLATFPGFIGSYRELSDISERDPLPEDSKSRIAALTKRIEAHVASKGWSGIDGFVEFNGRMVYYLTVYLVLKKYKAAAPRHTGAKERYREQMRIMEKDLGREGLSELVKNSDRILAMYRKSGMKELDQLK